MSKRFQHLSSFLSAWFHQDFDIAGGTLEEVVSSYLLSAPVEEVNCIRNDISSFLVVHPLSTSYELETDLGLEVDPLGFATSGKNFLLAINEKLAMGVRGVDA